MAWSFSTCCEAEVKIKPPKLNVTAHIFAQFHVTSQSNYNEFFGQDLIRKIGTNLYFQKIFVGWKETKILMISMNCKMRTNVAIQERKNIKSATNRIKKS